MQKTPTISAEEQYHLTRLSDRTQALLARSTATRQDMDMTRRNLVRMKQSFSAEFSHLGEDIARLTQSTATTIDSVRHVAAGFHLAVHDQDLARLQSRVDLWAPEKRISREQFRLLLKDRMDD